MSEQSRRRFRTNAMAAPLSPSILEAEAVMSLIDHAVKANEQFARRYDPKLGGHPQPEIAVVTCMDPRVSDLEGILGLWTAYGRHPPRRPGRH